MNPIKSYRRFVAVGCNHGQFTNEKVYREMLQFSKDYKPHFRIHLGDFLDTTTWRAGAKGTGDETMSIRDDFDSGLGYLSLFEPHLVFCGNHDHRPYRYLNHPSAIVRHAAQACVSEMESSIANLKAEFVPYHVLTGWRLVGNALFGHGYMFNENAARDHSEMTGKQVVMAHIHTLSSQPGRVVGAPMGHSAGLLANINQLEYASARRSTSKWTNGWVYGEFNDEDTRVFLYRSRLGETSGAVFKRAAFLQAGGVAGQGHRRDVGGEHLESAPRPQVAGKARRHTA